MERFVAQPHVGRHNEPMNAEQQVTIESLVSENAKALFSAWSYLHLLQGMHAGSKSNPVVVKKFDRFFDQIWRAVFDGLFARAGTLLDRTKGTHSLPGLLTLVRRYGDVELKAMVKQVQARLNARDGSIAKFESWRHQVVAHRTAEGQNDDFYINNKMNLEDIAKGLMELEKLLNIVSLQLLRVHNDTEGGSRDLVEQGTTLFRYIAEHPSLLDKSSPN